MKYSRPWAYLVSFEDTLLYQFSIYKVLFIKGAEPGLISLVKLLIIVKYKIEVMNHYQTNQAMQQLHVN